MGKIEVQSFNKSPYFWTFSDNFVQNIVKFSQKIFTIFGLKSSKILWHLKMNRRWRRRWVFGQKSLELRRSLKLQRFLSKDPSSSSSSVYFQMPKNLRSFEDFRLKIAKIFWENLTIFWTKLSKKVQKYVLFLKLWTSIFPT